MKETNSFISSLKGFGNELKMLSKNIFKKKEAAQKKEDYSISIDDVRKAHENIPKRMALLSVGAGIVVILIMTVLTVREQVSQVDSERAIVKEIESVSFKDGEVSIDIDEQGWKHFQSKKIDRIYEKSQAALEKTKEEIKKDSTDLRKNIQSDLNNTMKTVESFVSTISEEIADLKEVLSQDINQTKIEMDTKLANSLKTMKETVQYNPRTILSTDTRLLPPALSNLSRKIQITTPIINPTIKEKKKKVEVPTVSFVEPDSMEYNYEDTSIDSIEVSYEDFGTAALVKKVKKIESPKLHIMKGLVKATLLTGINAPTFGGGSEKNPSPVLLSIDGDTLIANDEYQSIDNCLISGSAVGNINTGNADVLLTEISCSGFNTNGERVKIEQSLKGWVIGEDGSFGLSGRLLDSSGKVITKMIALEIVQSLANAMTLKALPQNSFTSGLTNTALPYDDAAQSGLGEGVESGLDKAFEHYNQILSGMYPTISVRAGKKVSILLKGGEDLKADVYKSIEIYEKFEVKDD